MELAGKSVGMPLKSCIFAAVEAAEDDAAELAQEIASQKIYSEKLITVLRSCGTWPGPSDMTGKASLDIFWLKDESLETALEQFRSIYEELGTGMNHKDTQENNLKAVLSGLEGARAIKTSGIFGSEFHEERL